MFHFFICYLAIPWPNLGYYREDSLTRLVLISTLLSMFDAKVNRSLLTSPFLGPSSMIPPYVLTQALNQIVRVVLWEETGAPPPCS